MPRRAFVRAATYCPSPPDTVHRFSVDSAGNIENNYKPDGSGGNYRKGVAALPG
jgi:hypothetical protein